MDKNQKKDIVIFFTALAVIAATFIGVGYLRSGGVQVVVGFNSSSTGLLADVGSSLSPLATSSDINATSTNAVATTTIITANPKTISSSSVTKKPKSPSSSEKSSIPSPDLAIAPDLTPNQPTPTITITEPVVVASTTATVSPAPTLATTTPKAVVPVAPAPTKPVVVALTLPYAESDFSADPNWVATWGKISTSSSESMELVPSVGGTGASVHLKNSESWTDYTFNASVDWVSGETFGLEARYHNDGSLVLCDFNEQAPGEFVIYLQQYVNGRVITLMQSAIIFMSDLTDRPNINASITVGSTIGSCSINGHEISNSLPAANTYLINDATPGGIGFTTWDPTPGKAEVIVKKVSVTSSY